MNGRRGLPGPVGSWTRALIVGAFALAVCGGCGAPGQQPAGSDLEEIVARTVDALGGMDRLSAISSIHTVDSLYMAGLSGTSESWWTRAPFRGRTRIDLGVVTQDVLFLEDSCWTLDRNGHLVGGDPQSTTQLALARATVFYDYLLRDPAASGLVLLGDTIVEESCEAVGLGLELGGGGAWDLDLQTFVSRDTWLPVVSRMRFAGMEVLSYPSRYETIQGVTVATATREEIPALAQVSTTRNTVTEFDIQLPDSVFEPLAGRVDWTFTAAEPSGEFFLDGQHVFMSGSVMGRSVDVLLDTGAGATVIDSALAADLELPLSGALTAQGVAGQQSFSFVEVGEYEVAGVRMQGQRLAVLPLDASFYPSTGHHIGLILGYDFTSRFITILDYGNRTIAFRDPSSFEYLGEGRALQVSMFHGLPTIGAVLEDSIEATLIVDTGAGGGIHLTPGFVERHPGFLDGRPTVSAVVQGVGGEDTATVFRMGSVSLGGLHAPGGLSSVSSMGDVIASEVDGILGAAVLARFTLFLDYPGSMIFIEPGAMFDTGLPEDKSGFGRTIAGSEIVVSQVLPDSPASEAGLEEGDALLALNGLPVGAEDFGMVAEVLSGAQGDTVHVLLRRAGSELGRILVLGRLLDRAR